ncbi:glyoxalase/bleomycin resistance/extradiol dioxygenase family protein [Mucilaginibacter hurinus]|uniref:Glyoxalase/bleomycin resistance/extradiol dioxygenase family protein n=1 Tax=Mucilaginibacter hurinus TaxID=2201324 RepID=A0A367GRY8_9SPHI|nr:VOC family protein [Mucilaginibacter hurinus]RCH56212.1 glyoxalase/bleomycin resistance/extradiol dioxygenase family protein [Mucilaginibacter hurinus]
MKATEIFVNLPVKNLDRAVEFFTKLGFTFNPQFTDEKATCMIIGENIYAMLLVEPFFETFLKGKKTIADAATTTEVLNAISLESREAVDKIVEDAVAAGGSEFTEAQDHGWMYSRNFQDLDGHVWEFLYADMAVLGDTNAAEASKA